MIRRMLLTQVLLLSAVGCAGADPSRSAAEGGAAAAKTDVAESDRQLVRELTRQFYDRELTQLHARFSDEMRQEFTLEKLTLLRDQVEELYGRETELLGEESDVRGEYRGFVRWARFERSEGIIALEWYLRADDQVAGFFVKPATKKIEAGS